MKRKKLERKQEDRKQSGEGNHHAGQSSHMTPPRSRNVSRECTPNNLKRKVDCVIYTSNSKTRLSKSPQTNRYNSDKKKIPSDFEEALDSSSGINFRSGRRIHYTSSSKTPVDSNKLEVSKSVVSSSDEKCTPSKSYSPKTRASKEQKILPNCFNCSPDIVFKSGRQINHHISPKLKAKGTGIHQESKNAIATNKSPQIKKTPIKKQSPQILKKCSERLNPRIANSPETSPGIHFRSGRRIFYSPNRNSYSSTPIRSPRMSGTPSSSSNKQDTSSELLRLRREKTRGDKLTPKLKKSTESSKGIIFRSGRRFYCSPSTNLGVDLNQESRGLITPKQPPLKKHTPLKSTEFKRSLQMSTSETPRASPVTRSCSKKLSISPAIPIKHERKSKTLKEEVGSDLDNTEKPKIKKRERFKRRLSEEEPFIRRKKLRSEVKNDELWEGFMPIRFKRLTPKKGGSHENDKSQKTKKGGTDGQDKDSSLSDGNQRRCFTDLYNEFLLKSESLAKYQQRTVRNNVKGSVSNDEVNKHQNIFKEVPKSSKSIIFTRNGQQKGVLDVQEILSKFKEECENEKKRKAQQHEKPSIPMLTDDDNDCVENKSGSLSNQTTLVDSSIITPKRSARLQEKRSSGRTPKSLSSLAVASNQQESGSKLNRSARALLSDSTQLNSSSEITDDCGGGKKNHELKLTNANEPATNKNKATAKLTKSEEREYHIAADVVLKNQQNKGTEQNKDIECQREIKTTPKSKTQTSQVTFSMATRRTPHRNKVKQGDERNQDKETSGICEDCDTGVTKEQGKLIRFIDKKKPNQDQDKKRHPELISARESLEYDIQEDEDNKTKLEQSNDSQLIKLQTGARTQECMEETGDVQDHIINSSHSTEFSNNALTKTAKSPINISQNDVDTQITSLLECENECVKEGTKDNQRVQDNRNEIIMEKSSIDKQRTEIIGSFQLDIITDILQTIVNQVEESAKIREVKLAGKCRPTENREMPAHESLPEISEHTSQKCSVSSVKTEHHDQVQSSRTTLNSKTEEAEAKHEPLKIVVRKTDHGAQIIKQSPQLPRLQQTPERYAIDPKTTEKGLLKNSQDIAKINKKEDTALHKQTRSKTRSGEGEVACVLDNPDIELRPFRNKEKQHPRPMPASVSNDKTSTLFK